MAENEIKNLEENNLIDEKELKNSASENVQLVEEGQVSASELRNVIDMDAILEEAKKNDLYSNMLEPCQKIGININAQLIAFFEEEITDISDIKISIQRGMERIKNRINKDNPYLVFDDSGNIDSDGIKNKIGKGQVPEYLKEYVEQEKEQVEDEERIKYETEPLPKEFIEKVFELSEEYKEIDKEIENNTEFKKNIETIESKTATKEEKEQAKKEVSEEDYIAYKIRDSFTELLTQRDGLITQKDLDEWGGKVYVLLNALKAVDETKLSKMSAYYKISIQEMIRQIKDITRLQEHEFSDENIKAKLRIENPEKESDEFIKDLRDKYNEGTKIEEKDAQEQDEKIKQIMQENKKAQLVNILKDMERLGFGKETDILEEYKNKTVLLLAKRDPELWEKSEKLYKKDEYTDLTLSILKRTIVSEAIDSLDKNKNHFVNSNLDEEKKRVAVLKREKTIVQMAIAYLETSDNNSMAYWTGKDVEMQRKAVEIIEKYLPETRLRYGGIAYNKVFDAFKNKFGEIQSVQNISDMEELRKASNIIANNVFRGKISLELHGSTGSELYSGRSIDEIFNDPTFQDELNEKKNVRKNTIYISDVKENMKKTFFDKVEDYEKEPSLPSREYAMIQSAVYIVFANKYIENFGNLGEGGIKQKAEKILFDKFPQCIKRTSSDLIIDEKLFNEAFAQYTKDFYNSDIMSQSVDGTTNYIKKTINDFVKTRKDALDKQQIMNDPKLIYKKQQEIKEKNQENTRKLKRDSDKSVLKFINVLKKGRNGTTEIDKIDELSDIVKKRLKNKISDEQEYNDAVAEIEKENVTEVEYENMSREAKLLILKHNTTNLVNDVCNPRGEVNEESLKKIFLYYLSIKKDLDKNPIKTIYVSKLKFALNKRMPELFDEGKVNDEKALEKYVELFGEELTSSEQMYEKIEDKVVGEFVGKIIDGIESGKGYDNDYASPLVYEKFQIEQLRLESANKEIKYNSDLAVDVVNDFADKYKAKQVNGLSKSDEITYVEDLIILANLFEETGKHKRLGAYYDEYDKLAKKTYEVVKNEVLANFPGVKVVNGKIDKNTLEEEYNKYLESNEISLPKDESIGDTAIYVTMRKRKHMERTTTIKDFELTSSIISAREKIEKINEEQKEVSISDGELEPIVEALGEELKVANPGERLAEEIADAEAEVPEISDDEVREAIEGRVEDMTVSQPVVQEKDKQIADDEVKPTFEKNSEDIHMAKNGIEEVIEDVVEEPKTAQTMVAEDMNVGVNEEEKSLVVKNESPIKAMFEKARKTIKDVLENVASKFGFGTSSNSDTSNNDTTSSGASSSGTEKPVQDTGVKDLTGYDQIQLVSPIEQEKTEGTGESKTEKTTRESDDPERG